MATEKNKKMKKKKSFFLDSVFTDFFLRKWFFIRKKPVINRLCLIENSNKRNFILTF